MSHVVSQTSQPTLRLRRSTHLIGLQLISLGLKALKKCLACQEKVWPPMLGTLHGQMSCTEQHTTNIQNQHLMSPKWRTTTSGRPLNNKRLEGRIVGKMQRCETRTRSANMTRVGLPWLILPSVCSFFPFQPEAKQSSPILSGQHFPARLRRSCTGETCPY